MTAGLGGCLVGSGRQVRETVFWHLNLIATVENSLSGFAQ
jgi:hypothetical protein